MAWGDQGGIRQPQAAPETAARPTPEMAVRLFHGWPAGRKGVSDGDVAEGLYKLKMGKRSNNKQHLDLTHIIPYKPMGPPKGFNGV
jgi:hypothetical protein